MDAQNIVSLAFELEDNVYNEGLIDTRSFYFFMELIERGITNIKLFKEHYQGQYCLPEIEGAQVFIDSQYLAINKAKGFKTTSSLNVFEVFKRVKS